MSFAKFVAYIVSMKIDIDFSQTLAKEWLEESAEPWLVLPKLSDIIRQIQSALGPDYTQVAPEVFVHKSAKIAPTACVLGPCIIGPKTEIRHCAFVRGSAIFGEGCVVGNSTEVKNSIFSNGAKAPHFNYVGDSILGKNAHLGAGAITSNVKGNGTRVSVFVGTKKYDTGLKKFGAIVGDNAEVGCNAVLCPGTIVGSGVQVYPLVLVRGVVPKNTIVKSSTNIAKKEF